MAATELVIFDCDGVLVDSEVISNSVLAEMLTEQGLATTLAAARATYQGMLLSEVQQAAETALGQPLPEGWLGDYEARRELAFERELEPVAGARGAVAAVLGAGLRACVASQGKLSKTATSLALTGLEGCFPPSVRFSAETVPRGKPAPDLFLHAAATLGVEPGACVVVEDTPSGVRAGVSAGMRVFGLTIDSDAAALIAAGAEPLAHMSELPLRLGLT